MSYITRKEIKTILDEYPAYQEKLYIRGFLITNKKGLPMDGYPFYGNWNEKNYNNEWFIYTHKYVKSFLLEKENLAFFIVGHAYNPFTMQYEENEILETLSEAFQKSKKSYWEKVSELTGVFCIGYISDGDITFSTDAAGMQLVYYGKGKNYTYITSHSKIFNDFFGLKQTDYIRRLVNSRFYHYWGTWLPADYSPYKGIYRALPNFAYTYSDKEFSYERYYPLEKVEEVSQEKYDEVLSEIAQIMKNTMNLIAEKWPDKRAAISVTGGRDSGMTLASAVDVYDDLAYFSYQSNVDESVDAEAAINICKHLGLEHKVYDIPKTDEEIEDIEIIRKILECNAGCIGHNNANDVRKRAYFNKINDFDVEIKSWVDELSRAEAQNKYDTLRWPKKPSKGYYRCMWKVIVNPRLILESDRIFKRFLKKFYDDGVTERLPWMDLFYWEFSWGGGEGMFLTSEHKFTYDVTIPYNNRKLLNLMFTVPFEKRLKSGIQIDTVRKNNPALAEAGIHIKDISHTDFRAFIIRLYLRIFSKL